MLSDSFFIFALTAMTFLEVPEPLLFAAFKEFIGSSMLAEGGTSMAYRFSVALSRVQAVS